MSDTPLSQPGSRDELIAAVTSIRGLYTSYERLDRIKNTISRLLVRPSGSSEGAIYALLGETRAGKSQLLRVLKHEYPRVRQGITNLDGDFADSVPLVIAKLPNATLKAVTARVFFELVGLWPERVLGPRYTQATAQIEIIRVAGECHLKLLVLDEAHQSIDRKTDKVAGDVAVFVKDLSNAAKFSILIVGTEKATALLEADPELKSRVHKILRVRAFERRHSDLEVWLTILRDVDAHLERRVFGMRANLDGPEMAEALMTAAGGVVGNMATLVENAGHEAVDEMLEKGTPLSVKWEHLETAFSEWRPGGKRPNPFSLKNRPPAFGSDIMPDLVEADEYETDETNAVMSGVKGRVRRNHADTKFRP